MWLANPNGLTGLPKQIEVLRGTFLNLLFVVVLGSIGFSAYAEEPQSIEKTPASLNETSEKLDAPVKPNLTELPVSPIRNSDVAKAATSQGVSPSQYLNLVLGLVVILGFIFFIAWLLRRIGGTPTASTGAMKIIAGISLGSRDRVVLLQVGEKQILVSASPGNINLIHAFDEPAIEVDRASTGSDFYQKLQASLNMGVGRSVEQDSKS